MTRLLLIGAGGLDWGTFDARTRPEAGADALPALSALRARGVAGWLGGAPQTIGPAAWASIATGVQPEVHGVWREQEEWAGGLRPTGKASWRVAPLWARLEAAGISTGSVGWRGIRPGSAWAGLHIDDEYAEATGYAAPGLGDAAPLHAVRSSRNSEVSPCSCDGHHGDHARAPGSRHRERRSIA